ncbi:MAG: SprT-like family protein [Clostridia bacterium]|nr:SprT-like family protein [Clostridia bacterium]
MKQLTEYNRVSGYLNKIFNLLNERYFENALSKPVITIQSTPKAYGHVSVCDRWISDGNGRKELNIGAGTLNRPIEEVVATMLHEMVHIYNMQNGIQDTSRGYSYHNKRFKEEAEKRDLIIDHHERYGWTITKPTDSLIEFCIENELDEIRVTRLDSAITPPQTPRKPKTDDESDDEGEEPKKKKSSTRKYVCPLCGASVRATRDLSLICGECYKIDQSINFMIKK